MSGGADYRQQQEQEEQQMAELLAIFAKQKEQCKRILEAKDDDGLQDTKQD